jgi:hypothetical protein
VYSTHDSDWEEERRTRFDPGGFVRGVVSNALGNVLGAVILYLAGVGWRLIQSGNGLSWSTLPKFPFVVRPTIWSWLVPLIIGIATGVRGPFRNTNERIDSLLGNAMLWPGLLGIFVWAATHPYKWTLGVLVLWLDQRIHVVSHLRDAETFTSLYVLLFLFGLIASALGQAIWKPKINNGPALRSGDEAGDA